MRVLLLPDRQARLSSALCAVLHGNALMLFVLLLSDFSPNENGRLTEPPVKRLNWLRWHNPLRDHG